MEKNAGEEVGPEVAAKPKSNARTIFQGLDLYSQSFFHHSPQSSFRLSGVVWSGLVSISYISYIS